MHVICTRKNSLIYSSMKFPREEITSKAASVFLTCTWNDARSLWLSLHHLLELHTGPGLCLQSTPQSERHQIYIPHGKSVTSVCVVLSCHTGDVCAAFWSAFTDVTASTRWGCRAIFFHPWDCSAALAMSRSYVSKSGCGCCQGFFRKCLGSESKGFPCENLCFAMGVP